MRSSGLVACVGVGALVVGFGAGWLARGVQRPQGGDDAIDTPTRKPITTHSAGTSTAVATALPSPAPTPNAAAPWTYPSSLPPGACDPPSGGTFAWPTTPAPPNDMVSVDATHYLLDAGFVDAFLEDQAELMKSARIVPQMQDGQVVGIKVFGIKTGSMLDRLGLENGDSVVCMNAYPLASPEMALEAYSKLRTTKDLDVGVVRGGKAVVLHYHVTGSTPPKKSPPPKTKKGDIQDPFDPIH